MGRYRLVSLADKIFRFFNALNVCIAISNDITIHVNRIEGITKITDMHTHTKSRIYINSTYRDFSHSSVINHE